MSGNGRHLILTLRIYFNLYLECFSLTTYIQDIKVVMRTEPLDVIYNEGVVRKVQQFFSPRRRAQSMSKEMSEFHLAGRFLFISSQICALTGLGIIEFYHKLIRKGNLFLSYLNRV